MTDNELGVPAPSDLAPSFPLIHGEDQIDRGELAEDVMDISRSDVDEGEITEITDYISEPSGAIMNSNALPDREDTYEPPLTINPVTMDIPAFQQDGPTTQVSLSDTSEVPPDDNLEDSEKPRVPKTSRDSSENADGLGESLATSRSQSSTDDSDQDDYEPPEPVTPAEGPILPLNHDVDSLEPLNPSRDTDSPSANHSLASSIAPINHGQVDSTVPEPEDIDNPEVCSLHHLQCRTNQLPGC